MVIVDNVLKDVSLNDIVDKKIIIPEGVKKIDSEVFLGNESIVKVVNKRFNDSANIMDDRGLTASKQIQLGERLYTDFNIILEAINQNKDLSGEEFNKSQFAGDKKTDLNGLLKAYQNYIQNTGKDIVLWDFNGMPVVKSNNEEMKAEEMLSVIRQKAMENSQGMEMNTVSKAV